MAEYLLFVDDSGNREYADNRVYGVRGKSRYFVYGGVLVEQRSASLLAMTIQELKQLVFRSTTVEVKSTWLRFPDDRRRRYIEPYGITEAQLTQFTDDYYQIVVGAPLTLIAAVVDKLHMQERYGNRAWYAPTVAYEVLMQRAMNAVVAPDVVNVTVDNISGRTPNHNEYQQLLVAHHDGLQRFGSRLQRSVPFGALRGPVRFMNSADSDLLQVADVTAYNVHRQFRDFGAEWELPLAPRPLPMYPYFQRIAGKFRRHANGRVQGFGIVKMPLVTRVPWRVRDGN